MPPKKNNTKIENSIMVKSDIPRLKMIYNYFPDFDTMSTNQLYKELNKKYPNRGTLNVISYTLKKFFSEIGEDNKAEFWGNIGAELGREVNKIESKNELTNNEKENWKTQEEILNIMNSIKILNRADYNRFLVLAMTTHQPPLRKGFYHSVKFLFNSKLNNGKDNYLLLQKPPLKSYYIVNNDKVSRHEKFTKDDSVFIEIDNKDLINLLWKSYNSNKRKYVFENENQKPYTLGSFSKVLLERPFNLNFNILRSSYVTAFYKEHGNLEARKSLAQKMRHSADVGHLNYYKDVK